MKRQWFGWLLMAIIGPLLVTVAYLLISTSLSDVVPAQGSAAATRDELAFLAYVATLVGLVALGGWKARGVALKVAFGLVALTVSAISAFLAFFGQMAP